jgi:hypothetical protein
VPKAPKGKALERAWIPIQKIHENITIQETKGTLLRLIIIKKYDIIRFIYRLPQAYDPKAASVTKGFCK